MKKILSLILCLFVVISLTGCGETETPIVDSDGGIIHYSEEEITEGYYILKDDGYYYQILQTTSETDNNGNIFIWFTEKYDAAIPRFTVKDKLLFYSETSRPSSVTLYKLTDYGYTLGIMFSVTNNTGDVKYPQIINFSGTYNPYSPVGDVINNTVTSNATTYITDINNHEFTTSLLVDNSFLKGLTKDTMYQIQMYCGTVRKSVNIKADTHLFLQENTYVTSGYEELKAKCFEISLPSNLSPGYYYAEGIGMFYYEGVLDDIDEDDIDNLMYESDSTEELSTEETSTEESDSSTINETTEEEVIGDVDELSVDESANSDVDENIDSTIENTENP